MFPRHVCFVCSKQTEPDSSDTSLTRLLVATAVLFCLASFLHSPTFVWRALFRSRARARLSLSLSHTHTHKYTHTNTNTNTQQERETLSKAICRVIWCSLSRAQCLSRSCSRACYMQSDWTLSFVHTDTHTLSRSCSVSLSRSLSLSRTHTNTYAHLHTHIHTHAQGSRKPGAKSASQTQNLIERTSNLASVGIAGTTSKRDRDEERP